jgi:hypothetical protein
LSQEGDLGYIFGWLLRFSVGDLQPERILCLDVDDFIFRVFVFHVLLFFLVALSGFFFTGYLGPSTLGGP